MTRNTNRRPVAIDPARRRLLLQGLGGAGVLATSLIAGCNGSGGGMRQSGEPASRIAELGPLGEPDENGLRLPEGFTSRVVARSGQRPYSGSPYLWHTFPDGGAVYAQPDGGWIYACNSEFLPGGVGALRFDSNGEIVDAYSILYGSLLNCAGGPTPWGTWLSCEEYEAGNVFECDPTGANGPVRLRALGTFKHEAAAVDPVREQVYLTEDTGDGGFYRFIPDAYPSLAAGRLQIAQVVGDDPATRRPVVWHDVPEPNPLLAVTNEFDAILEEIPGVGDLLQPVYSVIGQATRHQVAERTPFDGGEGIWFHEDIVYFTTKGDNRVWAYDTAAETIEIIYDDDLFDEPVLTGVDNVVVSAGGDVLVAEDGGDMQIVAITPDRRVLPVVQVTGQDGSEMTGPAFSPDGTRLYFNSQRGPEPSDSGLPLPGPNGAGITYEVRGPFVHEG